MPRYRNAGGSMSKKLLANVELKIDNANAVAHDGTYNCSFGNDFQVS